MGRGPGRSWCLKKKCSQSEGKREGGKKQITEGGKGGQEQETRLIFPQRETLFLFNSKMFSHKSCSNNTQKHEEKVKGPDILLPRDLVSNYEPLYGQVVWAQILAQPFSSFRS